MSLYHDAAAALSGAGADAGGSFKARLYANPKLKAQPTQVYALISETAKWDTVLKEVIENAGILQLEPKLTPILVLLLVHDLLFSKHGISAPASHPLRTAIERYKTRLRGEFTKVRVRRGCGTVEQLQAQLTAEKREKKGKSEVEPRWVRINKVLTTLERELETTFAGYARVDSLEALEEEEKKYYVDANVPDLIALAQGTDLSAWPAYGEGRLILQDKASCFPAYLLLGDDGPEWEGCLLDACAAPGNKTTHLASLLCSHKTKPKKGDLEETKQRIFALDASPARSQTLQHMIHVAGAHMVSVLAGQDFLATDPFDKRFSTVTALLLDPSCSGSGIKARDDVPQLALPNAESGHRQTSRKKRKRAHPSNNNDNLEKTLSSSSSSTADPARLTKLANLQTRIVTHAFHFPAARRVSYSTCSIHVQENEAVVARALASDVARRRGWWVLKREEQVRGLREWKHRGVSTPKIRDTRGDGEAREFDEDGREACLRCCAGDEAGTGGFFVVAFVRNGDNDEDGRVEEDEESEWEGFGD